MWFPRSSSSRGRRGRGGSHHRLSWGWPSSTASGAYYSSLLSGVGRRVARPRMRLRVKSLAFWTVAVALAYFALFHLFPVQIDLLSPRFHEQHKCPACYGESLCRRIYDGRVRLTNWTRCVYRYAQVNCNETSHHLLISPRQVHRVQVAQRQELLPRDAS